VRVNIPGCEVHVSTDDDGGVVLRVVGELDLATVAVLRDAVDSIPLIGVRLLVLDVTHLSFISAAGIRVALDAQHRLARSGGRLVLRGPNALMRRVLQAAGLDDQFEIDGPPLHD
jgi:anti-sigma B factor antagonist